MSMLNEDTSWLRHASEDMRNKFNDPIDVPQFFTPLKYILAVTFLCELYFNRSPCFLMNEIFIWLDLTLDVRQKDILSVVRFNGV